MHERNHLGSLSSFFTKVVGLLAVLLLFYPGVSFGQLDPLLDQCKRVDLDPGSTPVWVASGVWADESMYWVDAWRSEIIEVDPHSGEIEVRELPWQNILEEQWDRWLEDKTRQDQLGRPPVQGPATIWRNDEGYSLEYRVPLGFVYVDQNLSLSPNKAETTRVLSESEKIPDTAVGEKRARHKKSWLHDSYQTIPLGSGFMGFATIRATKGDGAAYSWGEAFVYVENSSFVRLGQNIPALDNSSSDLVQQYSRFYMPYMASVGDVGFALLLEETPSLMRYQPGFELEVLPNFPEDFATRPRLEARSQLTNIQNEFEWYHTLQESDLAVALYSIEDHLFLLGKKMERPHRAAWWMMELDPDSGAELHRYRLPIRPDALHLTVVPGPRVTTFIEKQAVQAARGGLPYLQVLSMTHIPTSWLTDPGEEVLDPKRRIPCQ